MRRQTAFLVFLICSVLAAGCAAPIKVRDEASLYLRGRCLEQFLDSGVHRYQHYAQSGTGQVVLALSDDGRGNQVCAQSSNNPNEVRGWGLLINTVTWDKLEIIAVARCESIRPASAPPCRVFARNNDIVWKEVKKSTLD